MIGIYGEYPDFLGNRQLDCSAGFGKALMELLRQTRPLLGKKSYQLDDYVGRVLEGINAIPISEVSLKGFEEFTHLHAICHCIMSGEFDHETAEHTFFDKACEFLKEIHFPYHEEATRTSLAVCLLADDFMESAPMRFLREKRHIFPFPFDIIRNKQLFHQLDETLHHDNTMQEIAFLIAQRYQYVRPLSAYLQGMNDSLVSHLLTFDRETGRWVFQLLEQNREPLNYMKNEEEEVF